MARQKRGLRGFTARGCAGVLFQLMSRCNVMQGKAFSCTSQGQFTTANRKQNNGSTIPQCFSLPGPRVPAELRNGGLLNCGCWCGSHSENKGVCLSLRGSIKQLALEFGSASGHNMFFSLAVSRGANLIENNLDAVPLFAFCGFGCQGRHPALYWRGSGPLKNRKPCFKTVALKALFPQLASCSHACFP